MSNGQQGGAYSTLCKPTLPHIKVLYPLVALPHIKVHFTVLARFHRTHFYPQYSCASFGWDREYAVKHLGAWCYRHIYEGS